MCLESWHLEQNESIENEIKLNLLNFIRVIHLNEQDFYSQSFSSQYFSDLEMTFKKNSNCLIGHCRAENKKEGIVANYLFTENGFELIEDVLPKKDVRSTTLMDRQHEYEQIHNKSSLKLKRS